MITVRGVSAVVLGIFSSLMLWCPSAGQAAALQIGYTPSPTPGLVEIEIEIHVSGCGGTDVWDCVFPSCVDVASADGEDAISVMAAVDAVMASARLIGLGPVFESAVAVPGTAGEVRHEYRVRAEVEWLALVDAWIRVTRGGISFSVREPCGETDYPPDLTGPYRVSIRGVPQTAGDFAVHCEGKPAVKVPADPTSTPQAIADAILAEALAAGIHASPGGSASVMFNPGRNDQDVSGLDYVGMADGSPIPFEVANLIELWVPTRTGTWGRVKATYR